MRTCRVCRKTNEEVDFVPKNLICKPCKVAYQRGWYTKNADKVEASRKRLKDNGSRNRSDLRRCAKNLGLDPDHIEKHFETHHGLCDICGGPPVGKTRLAIDHDHVSGKFRGLLCTNCNQGLGRFKDSTVFLDSAIKYLESTDD